jgi:SanA protein
MLFINMIIVDISKEYIYKNIDDFPETQAALVLGARVYNNGALSDVLRDRLLRAMDLYRAGKVKKFLLSGDHGRLSYDEVNNMKKFLLSHNINKEDIFLDHAGFETYDSVHRAKSIFCIDSMIVVTQAFHLNRAVFIGRMLGIKTYGFTADRMTYVGIRWYKMREKMARVKTFLKIIFRSKPKFLGDKIPITGDSQKSWD